MCSVESKWSSTAVGYSAGILQTRREVIRAQASAGAPPSSFSHEAIFTATDGKLDSLFSAPRERPIGLEKEVAACLEATLAHLPWFLHSGLTVEAGWVRSFIRSGDA